MKRFCTLLLCLSVATVAWGQAEVPPKAPASVVHCRECHTSDAPTTEHPSLVKCPRDMTRGIHATTEAPPTITLGQSGGPYAPVEFSHQAHAEMSEMGGGCYQCHHYDQGGRIQKCAECHSPDRARADVGKPDLKGAIHRLCIECHRQWSHSTDCTTCHGQTPLPAAQSSRLVIYETNYEEGEIVTFLHEEHVTRFGLACSDCHQQESCASCHDPNRNGGLDGAAARSRTGKAAPEATRNAALEPIFDIAAAGPGGAAVLPEEPVEDHKSCASCHDNDDCSSCHSKEPVDTFDHGRSTGWIHNRFHSRLECQDCHVSPGKFTSVDTDCESCHPDWQDSFDHLETGVALGEDHESLSCDLCHVDAAFVALPVCTDCHDDRSYPADKPGEDAGETGTP